MVRIGTAIAIAAVICPAPSYAQGLFEMLFGPRAEPVPLVRYAAREEGRVTKHAPRNEVRVPSPDEGSRTRRYVESAKPGPYVPPPTLPGHLGRFLQDSTLRAGDVVATEKGLMVYRGKGGAHHSEAQFLPVNSASKLVGDKLPLLVKMDRELRRTPIVIAEKDPPQPATIAASTFARQAELENPTPPKCRPGFVCRNLDRVSLVR